MKNTPQIAVVGSHAPALFIRVNRVPIAGETVMGWGYEEPVDGGKGSNQAIAAARLGGEVAFIGYVGADRMGDEGERWMREAGVDTTYLMRSEKSATVGGFVILDEHSLPAIVTAMGANGDLRNEDVDKCLEAIPDTKIMLTQFEIFPHVAVHAAKKARALGMTTIINPAPAPEGPLDGLDSADILTPNESEAKVLLGLSPDDEYDAEWMAKELQQKVGVKCVLVTVGEKGVVAAEGETVWSVKPPRVQAVNTTGAGDALNAALAVGLVNGMSLQKAAEWGCAAAAYSVTKPGTIPFYPTPEEVEDFLNSLSDSRSSNATS